MLCCRYGQIYGPWHGAGGAGGNTAVLEVAERGGVMSVGCYHQQPSGQIVWLRVTTWDIRGKAFGKEDGSARYTVYYGLDTGESLLYLGSEGGKLVFYWGDKE